MEKNNTEKLKEVLSQTISQENIEKKLKENIKSKTKSTSSSRKAKAMNSAQSIPKVTPQAKPKIKNTNDIKSINYIFYTLSIIIIISLSAVIYYLMKQEQPVDTKVIVKKVIEPKEVEVEVEVIKEKIVTKVETKIVDLDNKNFRKFYYTQKTKTLRCYDFKANSSLVTKTCKDKITNFVKNTKNLTRVEIISVVAEDDDILYSKIKDDIKSQPIGVQKLVKRYLTRGFSRERVIETSSFIRDNLNDYVVVTPTNYYVKSSKNNKGVIIKGFYTPESK